MSVRKISLFTIAGLLVTAGLSQVSAAVPTTPVPVRPCAPPAVTVIVKLGQASLEEYHGGDPAKRTQIYRSGEDARLPTKNPAAQPHRA